MRRTLFAFLITVLVCAPGLEARGKKYRHPLGVQIEIPSKWRAEPAAEGATLLPPGVKVDPQSEDNPEVYWLWIPEASGETEQQYVAGLKESFRQARIEVEREGDLEAFSSPGRPGVIYTFDFVHPVHQQACRVRVFAVQHNRRAALLIAKGRRDRLQARDAELREIARTVEWR
jgi:hypothetical protein